jgi:Fe2+ or Zn2+ uptake regulation protein
VLTPQATTDSSVRLHDAGMRSTLPRRAVLDTIASTAEHSSADEVRRALAGRGIDLPRSSVNNILGRLATAGLIRRVDTVPGPTRFERDTSDHDHFWCGTCRLIANVPAREVTPPRLPGRLTTTAVTYVGECRACTTNRKEGNTPQ